MKKHSILIICLALIAIAAVLSIVLYDDTHHGEESHFDAKETIFDHLVDHYSWEVPFSHSHKIYLPVIVKEKEGGWHMFMSDKIENGQTYEGFYIDNDQYKGKIVGTAADGTVYRPVDISINEKRFGVVHYSIRGVPLYIPVGQLVQETWQQSASRLYRGIRVTYGHDIYRHDKAHPRREKRTPLCALSTHSLLLHLCDELDGTDGHLPGRSQPHRQHIYHTRTGTMHLYNRQPVWYKRILERDILA